MLSSNIFFQERSKFRTVSQRFFSVQSAVSRRFVQETGISGRKAIVVMIL